MKSCCFVAYQNERHALSSQEIDQILEEGRKWDLSSCLQERGIVVFPHTYLHVCGSHTAACVHAALDSGADQVLAIGVLHSLSEEMQAARAKERQKQDVSQIPLRGVHGPGRTKGDYWQDEYSLLNFIFLWEEEVKRREIRHPPKLIIRYPYLVNFHPETLPGVQELEEIARDSVVVATADFLHHGIAYGHPRETCMEISSQAERMTQQHIEMHLQILAEQDTESYYNHCLKIYSDAFDVGPILRHLRGPLRPTVHSLTLGDVSPLFEGHPHPSWVAASLVSLSK